MRKAPGGSERRGRGRRELGPARGGRGAPAGPAQGPASVSDYNGNPYFSHSSLPLCHHIKKLWLQEGDGEINGTLNSDRTVKSPLTRWG